MPLGEAVAVGLQGFGLGAGLIIAIGAQNAYVLRQGLRRAHVFAVATVCILCDIALIAAGAAGVGTLVAANPLLTQIAAWGGGLFLLAYGARAAWSAIRPKALEAGSAAAVGSRWSAVTTALALSLLNPHVYLDTVVLLGSIAGQHAGPGRVWFAAGAITASLVWFYALGYGAAWLAPLFRRPVAWRVLDAGIALIMWTIAASLMISALS